MSRSKKNPLSRQARRRTEKGAVAKADQGASDGEHTAESAESLLRLGVTLALSGIDALALLTDDPAAGIVDAADLIEAAAEQLHGGGET